MNTQSAIMVKLPEIFSGKEARKLARELRTKMSGESPSVLVDLSRVREMDLAGLEGLLDCMEAIARHDGTLQLGKISAEAATFLELTQMDRLFQKFPALDAAVSLAPEEEPVTEGQELIAQKIIQPQPVAA